MAKSKMTGVRAHRAALKRAPAALRLEVFDGIEETVDGVHARGKANIASMFTSRSGDLNRFYRKSLSKKTLKGRVGYLSKATRQKVPQARFQNDGTVNIAARPFHTNAVEAEREVDTARMVRARDNALRKARLL